MRQERLDKILPCVGGKCTYWSIFWSPTVRERGWKKIKTWKHLKGSDFQCDLLQPNGELRDGVCVSSNRYQSQVGHFLYDRRCSFRLDCLVLRLKCWVSLFTSKCLELNLQRNFKNVIPRRTQLLQECTNKLIEKYKTLVNKLLSITNSLAKKKVIHQFCTLFTLIRFIYFGKMGAFCLKW